MIELTFQWPDLHELPSTFLPDDPKRKGMENEKKFVVIVPRLDGNILSVLVSLLLARVMFVSYSRRKEFRDKWVTLAEPIGSADGIKNIKSITKDLIGLSQFYSYKDILFSGGLLIGDVSNTMAVLDVLKELNAHNINYEILFSKIDIEAIRSILKEESWQKEEVEKFQKYYMSSLKLFSYYKAEDGFLNIITTFPCNLDHIFKVTDELGLDSATVKADITPEKLILLMKQCNQKFFELIKNLYENNSDDYLLLEEASPLYKLICKTGGLHVSEEPQNVDLKVSFNRSSKQEAKEPVFKLRILEVEKLKADEEAHNSSPVTKCSSPRRVSFSSTLTVSTFSNSGGVSVKKVVNGSPEDAVKEVTIGFSPVS